MRERLYLIWYSYKTNEYLVIGYLEREKETDKYYYTSTKDAVKAEEQGCMLPLPYNDGKSVETDSLPSFFKARVLDSEREGQQQGKMDEFMYLISSRGEKNSDNFLTLSEEDYNKLGKTRT